MLLIDRHILARFLANFLVLMVLLYLFAAAIDLVAALDEYASAARSRAEAEGAGGLRSFLLFVRFTVDFQAPKIFQFYAYLHGLLAIGAAGFTLAQMHRHRELVALLASGLGMTRLAMPFVIGMFAVSALQLVNQELVLPRVAPLLLRTHEDIGRRSVGTFPVDFTPDGGGHLLQSSSFDPRTGILESPTVLVRDDRGRTLERLTASRATWGSAVDDEGVRRPGWSLEEGRAVRLGAAETDDGAAPLLAEPRAFWATDLAPRVLVVRRHGQFAAMLSLAQIAEILDTPGVARRADVLDALARFRYARFATVLVNVLVMWLALPAFLLREPANLLVRSVICAATALPALLGSAVFMLLDLPGVPPAASVFLPVVVLLPVVIARWMFVRS